ncbi:GAS2-like protein 1 [Physella acuta]|uniref:GAS2-like protein 1 n=1 Tax=Physella acuta TaxID=109671 RepID=UPI0027DCF8E4|nr:GAS2-like protein 1 [Physella acuta]
MSSDSPGMYSKISHQLAEGQCGLHLGKDGQREFKDSGYYVSTSDGASTCSSSTTEAGDFETGTLLVLEPKSLRSFTTNDEYLYAMKEDLADWFSCLYQTVISAESFFAALETGVLLCKHANKMQEYARQRREKGESLEMKSYFIRSIPEGNVAFREGVKPETFQARDNVSNFISWGRQMGIPEVLSFETDDLVLRKNEKSVILCLLEIARVGAKLGMLAPTLVQMEEEIDAELAGEEPKPQVQIKTCDMRSLDERVRDLIQRCTCPIQFPMIKVGEGKYKIGDSRSLIFVRILRNHVMVRVGGGWDTLENYLNKHDPCQCNYRGHRGNTNPVFQSASSQQRRPSTTITRPPAPNTPTSPRRAPNTAPPPERSSSPQTTAPPPSNSRAKSPTLIISRHNPGSGKTSQPNFKVSRTATAPHETSSNPHHTASNQPTRSSSPALTRLRSPSPLNSPSRLVKSSNSSPLHSRGRSSEQLDRLKTLRNGSSAASISSEFDEELAFKENHLHYMDVSSQNGYDHPPIH